MSFVLLMRLTGNTTHMRDHFQEIYAARGADYDAMVSREDRMGNLLPALYRAGLTDGARVAEFGAGTGRLTRLIAPHVWHIAAFDGWIHMLHEGRWPSDEADLTLAAALNEAIPLPSHWADAAIAGWSFGHATGWYPDTWREQIGAALGEMRRVTRPGGALIILETLGTGMTQPLPPNDILAAYYVWLEGEHGFTRQAIRTDYQFADLNEADRLTRFFFGDELADRVRRENLVVLPECTGIWSRFNAPDGSN